MRLTHRVIFAVHVRPLAAGECVLHSCDNPPCCEPSHLFGGSKSGNARDAIAKGRVIPPDWRARRAQPSGERNGSAKLKAHEVIAIRADPRTAREVAEAYGVKRITVHDIRQRRSWRHLP